MNKEPPIVSNHALKSPILQSKWPILTAAYVSYRMALANLAPITDCDEVYNYWEPLHFMIYGSGFQTWEYSKQFGLRTYMYLTPLYAIYNTIKLFGAIVDKRAVFQMLRATLGGLTGFCEIQFCKSISESFGKFAGVSTIISLALSPGMFHSAGALLPSATVMQLVMLSSSQAFPQGGSDSMAILYGLLATLCTGWPFAAILFVPLGLRAVHKEWTGPNGSILKVATLLSRTLLHTAMIQCVVSLIDFQYYKSIIFPSWNILRYNAMQGDDELYGVEPLSYYIKNLLLNFNLMAVMAVLALPLIFLKVIVDRKSQSNLSKRMYAISPMIIWFLLVGPRPHKEERFLFPIYPFLALASSFALEEVANLIASITFPYGKDHARYRVKTVIAAGFFVVVALISIGRSISLHVYYTAPLQVFSTLYTVISSGSLPLPLRPTRVVKVCIAGEWYRFPSSFMLPPNATLEFLPSGFKGQLPQPFTELGSSAEPHQLPQPFNDVNREEPSRYIQGGIVECDYLVELMLEPTDSRNEPDGVFHMNDPTSASWSELASFPFLDAEQTGILRRTLYIPTFLGKLGGVAYFADYKVFRQHKEDKDMDSVESIVKRLKKAHSEGRL